MVYIVNIHSKMDQYSIDNIVKSLKFPPTTGLQKIMSDYQNSGLKQNSVLYQEPQILIDTVLNTNQVCIPDEIDFQSNEDEFTDVCYNIIGSLNEQYIQEKEEEAKDEDTKADPEVIETGVPDKICITITEDEKSILKHLKKAQKAYQKCFIETKHKHPVEKKRIRNKYASQVSRLKKKLEIYHLKTELGKAYSKIEILQKLLNK